MEGLKLYKAKILIVEDEINMRRTLASVLKRKGYMVRGAGDGVESLNLLKQEDFDLILTDIRMPNMDGVELLKNVRKINPEIIVIVMTAYGSIENAVECMKLGATDYVTKPFSMDEIQVKIEKALENKLLKKQKDFLQEQNKLLWNEIESHFQKFGIIGKNKKILEIENIVAKIAD